ncbi:DNA-binding protein [Methanolobus zinderi]|uniref:DNA-binding protein n=1 Tax=Methanolobus zinderi TaxID=536044 RepID=A0A7D5I7N6_9EURY|nr:DNA-binding protein [Methanolobus zinderi]QLC49222.1 DNA-binding protein [Methanolobus zinderi]
MAEREMAYRLFAREFNDSQFQISPGADQSGEQDLHSPNFLVTRAGAKVNRLFIAGVVTEVEDIGNQKGGEKELWRARISDPTGTFTVYSGNYQPEASVFLSTVEVPSYVTVVGKVRSYEPGDGSVFVSVRPEEINIADENVRNRWVVETARLTLDRLDIFEDVLSSDMSETGIIEYLSSEGTPSYIKEGVCLAMDYYHTDVTYLKDLREDIRNALLTIDEGLSSEDGSRSDTESIILELLEQMNEGKGVEYALLLKEAGLKDISAEEVDSSIRSLLSRGHVYEPKVGFLRIVT